MPRKFASAVVDAEHGLSLSGWRKWEEMLRKIVLCDDEPEILEELEAVLRRIEQETEDIFEIRRFLSGEELLSGFPEDTELLFLDIRMGELNGMSVARQLREKYKELFLIFITSLVEYALEGYDVHAFAFLTKPVKEEAVRRQVGEIFARIDGKRNARLTLKDGAASDVLDINEILYAEVYRHNTVLVLKNRKKEYIIPLNAIEEQLTDFGFFRCHKSYLVNMKQIGRIATADLTMQNGDVIPLSKHRRKDFLAAYARVMGECI